MIMSDDEVPQQQNNIQPPASSNGMPPQGMERFPPPGMMNPNIRAGMPANMRGPPPGQFSPQFPPNNFQGHNMVPPFRPSFGMPPPNNTTLPKPPIIDKEGEVWFEACSAEGKVYYFNAKTRETKWEKPDMLSEDNEKKTEENNEEVTEPLPKPSESDENETDKPKEGDSNSEDKQQEPESSEVQPTATSAVNPPPSTYPQRMPPPAVSGPPPFGMPPIMRGLPPNFNSPPFMHHMPPGMMNVPSGMSNFPPFPGFRMPPPDFIPKTIGDWTEHRLPNGRLYYYNNTNQESKWEKPKEFVSGGEHKDVSMSSVDRVDEVARKKRRDDNKSSSKVGEKTDDESANKQKPIASKPVSGTGWHLVWTGDGKVFFFHPTTKTSIWERPKELESNTFVDELLRKGPLDKSDEQSKTSEQLSSSISDTETKKDVEMESVASATTTTDEIKQGDSQLEDLNEPEVKKLKLDTPQTEDITDLPMENEKKDEIKSEERQQSQVIREAQVKKAIIPLDERMTMFTQLLREKEVSAFSTWEKELHKILFDPRYLLLTMKERKNCYEKFVKLRAVEERKERIQKLKEKKEEFKKLLDEVISNGRTSFSDFAAKNSKDIRYKAIEKMRDRELLFNEFMVDFKKHERERLKIREEKLRKNFYDLLNELSSINESSQWKKVKSSIESDRRYELVGSSSKREQFFYDYVKEKSNKTEEEENLWTTSKVAPMETESDIRDERPPSPPDEEAEGLDKIERIEASIRKREEEVRAQKELYEKDREKERDYHLHSKAVQHFNALLADMVKDTQFSWKETRRSFRKDPRWSALDVLDKSEKESLFNDHIEDIKDKRKRSFRKLLNSADISLDAYWRDVRRKIKDDPRYSKFGTSELREEEFEHYMKEKLTNARTDFRELLRETKLITYKSKKLADENPSHLKDINEILKKDKRYHILASLSRERERIIGSYLDELHKRGPPPPPTATNPSLRYKKD